MATFSSFVQSLFGARRVRTNKKVNPGKLKGFVQLEDRTVPASTLTEGLITGFIPGQGLVGATGAVGDLDGDGRAEIIMGSGKGVQNTVTVFSSSGQVLRSFTPFEASYRDGVFVGTGDFNGDGRAEIIVSPDVGGGPRVRIVDGQNFNTVADFFGIDDPNFRGGARVGAGDINGDRIDDLVVSAGFGGGPRVAVFDGSTVAAGNPVRIVSDFYAFEPGLRNGCYVDVGDVNGDGNGDVIIGAGPGGGPRVRVLSGKVMTDMRSPEGQLANFFSGPADNRGGVRVTAGDFNRDGVSEIMTGPGQGSPGTLYVLNGQGEQVLAINIPERLLDGAYVSTGNLDGDAFDEFGAFATRDGGLMGVYVGEVNNLPPVTPGNGGGNGGNVPPEIRPIVITLENNRQITLNGIGAMEGIGFPVTGDGVVVTAESSNINVVTASIGRSGSNYTLSLTATGYGTADVIVTVRDSRGQVVTRTLHITVPQPPNQAPTMADIPNLTLLTNTDATATFQVADDRGASNVTVTASSDNALVNLVVAGNGDTRTITATATANPGSALVTVRATDSDGATFTKTFQVNVSAPQNMAPSIANIGHVTIPAGEFRETDLGINDAETPVQNLTVTAVSSNQSVLPDSSLVLSGTGNPRKLRINAPAGSTGGTATVTLTVTDAGGLTATDTFVVTITPSNPAPSFGSVSVSLPGSQLPDVNLLQVGQEYTVGFLAARQTSSLSGPPTFFRELRTTVDNAAALNGVTLELWDVVGNQAVRVSTGVVNGNMVTFTMQDVLMVENNQEFQVRGRRDSSTPMGNWKLSLNSVLSVLFVNETGTMLPAGHVVLAGNPDFLGARVHNS